MRTNRMRNKSSSPQPTAAGIQTPSETQKPDTAAPPKGRVGLSGEDRARQHDVFRDRRRDHEKGDALESLLMDADGCVKPWQTQLAPDDYFISNVCRVVVYVHVKQRYSEHHVRHHRVVNMFSPILPDGELMDLHVAFASARITEGQFERARVMNWPQSHDDVSEILGLGPTILFSRRGHATIDYAKFDGDLKDAVSAALLAGLSVRSGATAEVLRILAPHALGAKIRVAAAKTGLSCFRAQKGVFAFYMRGGPDQESLRNPSRLIEYVEADRKAIGALWKVLKRRGWSETVEPGSGLRVLQLLKPETEPDES